MADVLDRSRRERQIMEIVYRTGRATAGEVLEGLPEPPSYSAVRALLKILEGKGHLKHLLEDGRYVWTPTVPRDRARRSALVLERIDRAGPKLSEDELERLARLIADAREEGR